MFGTHKIHFILSFITVGVIVTILVLSRGSVDAPTDLSSDDALKMDSLDGLPAVWKPTGSGDAAPIYTDFISLCVSNAASLNVDRKAPEDLVQKLTDLLVRGKDCPQITTGFADTPTLEPGAIPDYADAPRKGAWWVSERVIQQVRAKSMTAAEAEPILQGVWALGQRLFQNNVRSFARYTGFSVMNSAIRARMMIDGTPTAAALKAWSDGKKSTEERWMNKKTMYSPNVSVGDLQRIAELDQERTFRIEALLQMGVARWTKPTRGNLRAIEQTLEKCSGDKDPLVVQAAKVAGNSTREMVRSMH